MHGVYNLHMVSELACVINRCDDMRLLSLVHKRSSEFHLGFPTPTLGLVALGKPAGVSQAVL